MISAHRSKGRNWSIDMDFLSVLIIKFRNVHVVKNV